jgi:protein-ribulosamine 3-kinase
MTLELLATAIGNSLGVSLHSQPASRVHGGSINECYRWESNAGPFFVKLAPARGSAMFEAEAAGLEELGRAKAVRVPRVMGVGTSAGKAWLALEWIQSGTLSRTTDAVLGEQLARQHRSTRPAFGWSRDNTIGSTPQLNDWDDNWVTFFRDRRLRYQLDLAESNGYGDRLQHRGKALLDRVGEFFSTYQPAPSLLHGDLWGGNRGADEQGHPVIFDPAVYYGDREADLAMTRLFGGFGAAFYSAYESAWVLDAGATVRTDLYNLYHVLNHLNLFGSGYLGQATSLIDGLLAELGH